MVFVDTSACLAVLDGDDRFHAPAVGILSTLAEDRAELVSHDHVVVETLALVDKRLGRRVVSRFIDDLLPVIEMVVVGEARFRGALEVYRSGALGRVSFTDVTSFLLMRELGIRQAFAFDSDFERAGFELL